MGRNSLLTDQVQTAICEAIAAAVPFDVAAAHAGIDRATFWRWMDLGKPERECIPADDKAKATAPCAEAVAGTPHEPGTCPHLSRYRDFRDAVERREADLHTKLAGSIVAAAPRDWHAAQAILKAKWPKTWNVPILTQFDGGLEVEVTLTARDRVREKLEQLATRGLIALPAATRHDEPRLDGEEEADDARDEDPEDRPTEEPTRATRRSPRRQQRGPIVA